MNKALSYCTAAIRDRDYDRYLSNLFAPRTARERLIALHAFDLELMRACEAPREPAAGAIRLRWWSGALEEVDAGAPAAHPVLQALSAAGAADWLPRDRTEALIEARARALDHTPFRDRAEATAYVDATAGAVVELALSALGAQTDAARAAGRAWGFCSLARAARSRTHPRLRSDDPVRALALQASAHLAELPRRVPRAVLPALLPASLTRPWLSRLSKAGYAAEVALVEPGLVVRQWRAVAHWATGRP